MVFVVAAGLAAFAGLYRSPGTGSDARKISVRPAGPVLMALLIAGLIWGFYNAALGMVFGFGTTMLVERGWPVTAASSATSIVLWLVAISVPLGGIVSDRTGRPIAVLFASCLLFAVALAFAARTAAVVPAFVILGFVSGLAAGPIMTLPARILPPEARGIGMGIFFALFYLIVVLAPWIAGSIAKAFGSAGVTFDIGAVMLLLCCLGAFAFQWLAARIEGGAQRDLTHLPAR
jgi:MFS family permease